MKVWDQKEHQWDNEDQPNPGKNKLVSHGYTCKKCNESMKGQCVIFSEVELIPEENDARKPKLCPYNKKIKPQWKKAKWLMSGWNLL